MTEKNVNIQADTNEDDRPENEQPSTQLTVGNQFINEKALTAQEAQKAYEVLAKVTAYTGAKSHSVDEFLNSPTKIFGAIEQPITLSKTIVDSETGESIDIPIPANRIVAKLENGEVLSFVSKAADSFFRGFIFPVFGKGDFAFPVTIKVTQVSKGLGRTFNFSVIPDAK